jgi:hypothetical protein
MATRHRGSAGALAIEKSYLSQFFVTDFVTGNTAPEQPPGSGYCLYTELPHPGTDLGVTSPLISSRGLGAREAYRLMRVYP